MFFKIFTIYLILLASFLNAKSFAQSKKLLLKEVYFDNQNTFYCLNKYSILLIYDENNRKFAKQNDKITTYSLENGVVKDIKFLSSTNELGNLLK